MNILENSEEIKIGLFGLKGAGKKSIIDWYCQQKKDEKMNYILFNLNDGKQVKLFLSYESYDDEYSLLSNNLITNFYENIIFVIDLTNTKSFDLVKKMIKVLKDNEEIFVKKCIFIFINKFDLIKERQIEPKIVKSYADENQIKSFLINTKTGYQMNIGLSYFVNLIHDKKIGKINNESDYYKEREETEETEEEEEYEEYEEYEVSEEIVKRGKYVKNFVCCW